MLPKESTHQTTPVLGQAKAQHSNRQLKFSESIREALDLCLSADNSVYLMGLGVPDPKGIFGTTLGLQEKFGAARVFDMPTSENGMTGVAIGSALVGMRPVMVHQRLDFALLAMEQIVNQAANWFYMYGGQSKMPLVIRLIIGRGWGQGPQHSQSLQSWFAHIPGLKVVMPTTPHDAKGLLISSIQDNNPVIFLEHRWLHNISDTVPEGMYHIPIGKGRIVRSGSDVTIVASSYMTLESLRAAQVLANEGINCEVIDLRSIRPLDDQLIKASVQKTGRLVVADASWATCGIGSEIITRVVEDDFASLKSPPIRVHLPDSPSPSSPALAKHYYPRAVHIVEKIHQLFGRKFQNTEMLEPPGVPLDIPDPSFTGPF